MAMPWASRRTIRGVYRVNMQTVIDRAQIHDLICKYSRGLDRIDEATLRSIYWDDAIEDRGAGLYIGNAQEWVRWTLGVLPAFALTQHGLMQSLVEVEGDVAFGETYFQAYHRFGQAAQQQASATLIEKDKSDELKWPEGETELILAGRYLDRFEKRGDVWKISYRRMVCDWCRAQPVADDWFKDNPTAYRSQRTIADARAPRR
jgi:hypothetical protein